MTATTLHRSASWPNLSGLLALLVVAATIGGVWRSLDPLLGAWSQEEYSHAWFILPLSALIFVQRFRLVRPGQSSAAGIGVVAISIVITFFAWATGSYTASIYSAILGFIGFVWTSTGTEAMKRLLAPLIYLFFMVPLPVVIYISTSAEMQLLSSKLGLAFISLFHVPATLDGNIIVLASARLEVAQACSGLRYLFPLISFAFLTSMMVEDRLWKKAIVIISSIPIAILLNAARIAMIAVLLERFDLDTSTGSAHALEGFAVFFCCILLLFLEMWLLLKLGRPRGRFIFSDLLLFDRKGFQRLMAWPVSRASLIAGTILVVGAGIVAGLPLRAEVIPERRPLALFPMELKGWHGTPQTLDGDSLNALGLSDYVVADYTNDAEGGRPINFYVAYYESQRAGIHAHSPQLCIPGGGWSIINQSIMTVPIDSAATIQANRVVIEKQGARQIVYYWFDERGRQIADESSLKYYALKDALFQDRSDGALVRIVVPSQDDDEKADMMARNLAEAASTVLSLYVPGTGGAR